MGLFKKVKVAEQKEVAKEDFSALNDLQVLERIDAYNNEVKENVTVANFDKLMMAVKEFDKRVATMPLTKKATFTQDWTGITALVNTLEYSMIKHPMYQTPMMKAQLPVATRPSFDNISGMVARVYAELSK